MSDKKLQKLLAVARILEEASLASVRGLIAQEHAIQQEISNLENIPDVRVDDMNFATVANYDHWVDWRRDRIETLNEEREPVAINLEKARILARQSLGRRHAIEAALDRHRLNMKRLHEQRAAQKDGFA